MSLPIDAPRQFPMWELWSRPYGAHPHLPMPLGCGIHGPQDYDVTEEYDHLETCIVNVKFSILDGTVGFSRLHDALDLADRTARSRKPRKGTKRVRFSLNCTTSISEKRNNSYFAADLDYEDIAPEVDSVAYYCVNIHCGCEVKRLFHTADEHEEHVWKKRKMEGSSSDVSEIKMESPIKPSAPSSEGPMARKRKRGEGLSTDAEARPRPQDE